MTNLRRLMVVVVAIVMVVTSMATAFGAPLSDISGKKYEDAVNKLVAFNIAEGIDGQYKGEEKLTRAEFATFIVKMMGLGKQDPVDTIFSDATSKDWFSGYVNAVADAGYMVGADGMFNPSKNVTYGEAITVLMKMIGYAPVVDGRGQWPGNYIAKAGAIKLTKGVSVSASAPVTRGNLAILIWETMTQNMLIENGTYDKDGNPEYSVSQDGDNENLLYKNFDETVFVETDDGVVVKDIPMTSANGNSNKIQLGDNNWYTVPAGFDANSLLGLSINYVSDKDNNLKWIGIATKADNIIKDTVKEIEGSANKVTRIKMASSDKSYYADENMVLVYNGVKVEGTDLTALLPYIADVEYVKDYRDNAKVVAVIDNTSSKIVSAFITQDVKNTVLGAAYGNPYFGVVTSNEDGFIKAKGFPADVDVDDLNEKAGVKSIKLIVYKDDKVASLKDIKKNDFVRAAAKNNVYVFWAYTPKIETIKIDSLADATSFREVVVTSGDKTFKFAGALFRNFKTAASDRAEFKDENFTDLTKYLGVEGTKIYYGPSGKVNLIENKVADTTDLYGFVTTVDNKLHDGETVQEITLYKPDGTTVTYFAKDDNVTDVDQGDVITYSLNTKNEISAITVSSRTATAIIDGDDKYLETTTNGTTFANYAVSSSTVFVNWKNYTDFVAASDKDEFDFEFDTVTWGSLLDATAPRSIGRAVAAGFEAYVTIKDGLVKFVVLKETETTLGGDSRYGVIVGTGLNEDGQTIKINYKGVVTEYQFEETADLIYGRKGLPVEFSISGDDADLKDVSDTVYNFPTNPRLTFDYSKFDRPNGVFVAKVSGIDTTERTLQYRPIKDYKATNDGTAIYATYVNDKIGIYDIRDVNNITYTTDLSKIEKDMIIVYDKSGDDDIILIIKSDTDYTKSMLKQ